MLLFTSPKALRTEMLVRKLAIRPLRRPAQGLRQIWAHPLALGVTAVFLATTIIPGYVIVTSLFADRTARDKAVQEVSNQLSKQWGGISIDPGSVDFNADHFKVTLRLGGCTNVPAHFQNIARRPPSGKQLGNLYIDIASHGKPTPIQVTTTPDQFVAALRANGLWHCVVMDHAFRAPGGR